MAGEASGDGMHGGRVAIVLAGAGSRGAYEAGALSVLLPLLKGSDAPRIILGTSVGALNAAMLASVIDKGVDAAATKLLEEWKTIRPEKVFRTPRRGAVTELAWHLRHSSGTAAGLVDTKPLEETISKIIQPSNFGHNVGSNGLETVGIVASACSTMQAVVFVEGKSVPSSAQQVQYVGTTLGSQHLLASSAFPIVFPPRWVADPNIGGDWYIDGGVHLNTPFKPAIDLGADRILVVGGTPSHSVVPPSPDTSPTVGDSNGQILHALLTDGLEADLVRLRATNQYVRALTGASVTPPPPATSGQPAHRMISYLTVSPSDDTLDAEAAKIYAAGWLSLLESLGGYKLLGTATCQRQRPGQFLSYICFDKNFVSRAIELGQADARAAIGGSHSIPWITP
jgi:NTE family protein